MKEYHDEYDYERETDSTILDIAIRVIGGNFFISLFFFIYPNTIPEWDEKHAFKKIYIYIYILTKNTYDIIAVDASFGQFLYQPEI